MTALNDVVNENAPRMVTYLNMIATDPTVANNKEGTFKQLFFLIQSPLSLSYSC
mgnify:CR=1 FL=1